MIVAKLRVFRWLSFCVVFFTTCCFGNNFPQNVPGLYGKNREKFKQMYLHGAASVEKDEMRRLELKNVFEESSTPDVQEKFVVSSVLGNYDPEKCGNIYSNFDAATREYFGREVSAKEAYRLLGEQLGVPESEQHLRVSAVPAAPAVQKKVQDKYYIEFKKILNNLLPLLEDFRFWIVCGVLVIGICAKWIYLFVRNVFINTGKKIRNIVNVCKTLSEPQKIFLLVTISAVAVMMISLCDRFDDWFYMFLRWLVCAAFVGGVIEKNSALIRFIFALGAILYNPVAPIHLGDRDVWCCCNLVSIVLLIISQIIVIKRNRKNGAA